MRGTKIAGNPAEAVVDRVEAHVESVMNNTISLIRQAVALATC
jgi:hypothetical protein